MKLFFFSLSSLSFLPHCLLPSLFLVLFSVFPGLTLDQPGPQGTLVRSVLSYVLPYLFIAVYFLVHSMWREK